VAERSFGIASELIRTRHDQRLDVFTLKSKPGF
jgi:hypothetical protein